MSKDDDYINKRFEDPLYFLNSSINNIEIPKSKKNQMIPNRFNIVSGIMWDGIDRSNDYEKRYLLKRNENMEEDYLKYKYRTENM